MRNFVVAFIVLLLSASASSQTTVAQTNRSSKSEQQIAELISQLSDALTRGDVVIMERIFADDYVATSPAGAVATKEQVIAAARAVVAARANPNAGGAIQSIEIDDVKTRFYGDTAVVTARTTAKGTARGQAFAVQVRNTIVCVKSKGRWQIVATQDTRIAQQPPSASTSPSTQPQ